ncbi:MAG: alpha/beta hydrolase [Patescibacteria group bacterium]|nr:alpha/beta hydrolase [Patescibacteria group bacterium]
MHAKRTIQVNNETVAYFEYPAVKPLKGVVLFCHGFPGGNRLTTMADTLNNLGYTVEEINYCGDQESGGTFSFLESVEDIKQLALHLKKEYAGVPLIALGFSAGGFYLCALVRTQPTLFDKIVLLNPLLDLSFLETPIMAELWDEARQTLRLRDKIFYENEMRQIADECNPVNFVSELQPKISIVQSDGDTVLPPKTAEFFFNSLPNPGIFKWIKDGQHSVSGNEPELIETIAL